MEGILGLLSENSVYEILKSEQDFLFDLPGV